MLLSNEQEQRLVEECTMVVVTFGDDLSIFNEGPTIAKFVEQVVERLDDDFHFIGQQTLCSKIRDWLEVYLIDNYSDDSPSVWYDDVLCVGCRSKDRPANY